MSKLTDAAIERLTMVVTRAIDNEDDGDQLRADLIAIGDLIKKGKEENDALLAACKAAKNLWTLGYQTCTQEWDHSDSPGALKLQADAAAITKQLDAAIAGGTG